MNKFLTQIIIVFVGILVVNFILYIPWKKDLKRYFENFDREFEYGTFLFADSHGVSLRSASERYHVHNLAYDADSYKDIRRKLEFLLRNEVTVDTVLLTVDPHTLCKYRDRDNNYLYTNTIDQPWSAIFPILIAQYTTSLPQRFQMTWGKSDTVVLRNESNTFLDVSENDQKIAMRNRLFKQFPDEAPSIDLQQELLNIIEICEAQHIVLIGLRYPQVPAYNTMIGDKDCGASELCVQRGIPVLNYQDSISDHGLFENQDHLTQKGGGILLKKIFRDLN